MNSPTADHRDVVASVSRLIAQLGVGGLVALMAEITEQQSNDLSPFWRATESGAVHARRSNSAPGGANVGALNRLPAEQMGALVDRDRELPQQDWCEETRWRRRNRVPGEKPFTLRSCTAPGAGRAEDSVICPRAIL